MVRVVNSLLVAKARNVVIISSVLVFLPKSSYVVAVETPGVFCVLVSPVAFVVQTSGLIVRLSSIGSGRRIRILRGVWPRKTCLMLVHGLPQSVCPPGGARGGWHAPLHVPLHALLTVVRLCSPYPCPGTLLRAWSCSCPRAPILPWLLGLLAQPVEAVHCCHIIYRHPAGTLGTGDATSVT